MEREKSFLFKALSIFLVIASVAVVYVSLFVGGLIDNYSASLHPARNLSVSASGKTVVKPDVAVLSFSVVSEGSDVAKITEENNKKMNQAIDYVKGQGIDQKDIRTSEYSLSPVYSQIGREIYSSFVPKISGYTLTQSVEVKIRDFSKITIIMGSLPSIGINKISNVYFSIDDPEQFLSKAREEAFMKAKEKAESIAKESGVSLRGIISVSEYSNGGYTPYYTKSVEGMGGSDVAIPAPSIEPGSKEVTVNVSLVYEIK